MYAVLYVRSCLDFIHVRAFTDELHYPGGGGRGVCQDLNNSFFLWKNSCRFSEHCRLLVRLQLPAPALYSPALFIIL